MRRRWRKITPRPAAWVHVVTGEGVTHDGRLFACDPRTAGGVLAALPAGVKLVHLCGPQPGGDTAGVRRWASESGDAAEGRHYFARTGFPVLRFTTAAGTTIGMQRWATWVGPDAGDTMSPHHAWQAWGSFTRALGEAPALATPAATGRELVQRLLPRDSAWEVLPESVQELIRSTSPQGRIELLPAPEGFEQIPAVHTMDGRLFYAALASSLPSGRPVWRRGEPVGRCKPAGCRRCADGGLCPFRQGWFRVRFTVPRDWPERWGALAVMRSTGSARWHWPITGTHDTWTTGTELRTAREVCGWPVEVIESVTFDGVDGPGPLDAWSRTMIRLWTAADGPVRAMLRAVILHTIGALHGRAHTMTTAVAWDQIPASMPASVVRADFTEDGMLWHEDVGQHEPDMAHPEWTAELWGRARARLIRGPGATGAFAVPNRELIGFATDAIYVTERCHWPDDGKPGRFRTKGERIGPFSWPRTLAELWNMGA